MTSPKNVTPDRSDNFKLHIAIDFGTDGMGVGYAFNGQVFLHSKWKSKRYGLTEKPKTILLLNDKGKTVAFGVDAKYKYVFHVFFEIGLINRI